ncbi:MAG TPA: phosphate ABC transporter substrate-binding protein PstS [Acidimicrobiales bacterium]|nr:phosphate ABC transporter substrate-binding protein PstS [Acidimicrobiales bacterium]
MPVRTLLRPAAVLLTAAALVGACGGSKSDDATTGDTGGTTAAKLAPATLNSSGSTFAQAFYEQSIAAFQEQQPEVTINYGGGGSGKGRQELQDQVTDFAGSDALIKPEDVPKYKGGEVLYVPTTAAPITVSYNLSGVDKLKLDAPTIAKIFQRQIKTWNDPAIAALNPGAKLPSTAITVAHRADGSGTTDQFTKYLAAAAPDAWTLGSGSTVNWPADTQAGNGNTGVAQIVKGTAGAVGYVDLSDARAAQLQMADLKNKAGKFVAPDVEAATAALENVTLNPDLSYSALDASGDTAYPITAGTWVLLYKNQVDKAKGEALKAFLTYVLTDGQKSARDIDYAALPDSMTKQALAQLNNIVLPG